MTQGSPLAPKLPLRLRSFPIPARGLTRDHGQALRATRQGRVAARSAWSKGRLGIAELLSVLLRPCRVLATVVGQWLPVLAVCTRPVCQPLLLPNWLWLRRQKRSVHILFDFSRKESRVHLCGRICLRLRASLVPLFAAPDRLERGQPRGLRSTRRQRAWTGRCGDDPLRQQLPTAGCRKHIQATRSTGGWRRASSIIGAPFGYGPQVDLWHGCLHGLQWCARLLSLCILCFPTSWKLEPGCRSCRQCVRLADPSSGAHWTCSVY